MSDGWEEEESLPVPENNYPRNSWRNSNREQGNNFKRNDRFSKNRNDSRNDHVSGAKETIKVPSRYVGRIIGNTIK